MLQSFPFRTSKLILCGHIASTPRFIVMAKDNLKEHKSGSQKSIVLHAFSDLSQVSPLVFVHILRNTYVPVCGKAIMKFQALRQQVIYALDSAPPPGPATYVVCCLKALLLHDAHYNEALSHLLTSALTSLEKEDKNFADAKESQKMASRFFYNVITGSVILGERVLVKVATAFGLKLRDIGEVVHTPALNEAEKIERVKTCLEKFILRLIKSRLYTSAVALLKQFSLQHSTPHDFLVSMMHDSQFEAAEEWAVYVGKYMVCSFVRHCTEMGMFKKAYKIVEKYNLQQEFPHAYHQYRKSTLRKLIERGCWDVAESIANEDNLLVEYLVTLAQEVGNAEKAADLSHRHRLTYFPSYSVQGGVTETHYLQLQDFVSEENVIWVDTADGLANASRDISTFDIVGIDCEWKPNSLKGEKMNKVSILQIATAKKVYIIDLIKLYEEKRDELDNCLGYIFRSSNVLKLGYALHNDLGQLLHSYGEMLCFSYCGPVLDLQRLCTHSKGGLSGLAKITVGRFLNKASRMTDWEKRPLSPDQLHYAALDAAVLISIFKFLSHQPVPFGEGNQDLSDWKSHVKCFRTNFSHQKLPSISLMVDEVNAKMVSSNTLGAKDESLGPDWEPDNLDASGPEENMHTCYNVNMPCTSEEELVSYTLGAKDESLGPDQEPDNLDASGPEANMHICHNVNMPCTSEEELVYVSCELLGLPVPGLLKSELQNYAQARLLPLPTYSVSRVIGNSNRMLYSCSLTVGNMKFFGCPSYSKRNAEISAAIIAISHLFKGYFAATEGNFFDTFYNHCLGLILSKETLLMLNDTDPSIEHGA